MAKTIDTRNAGGQLVILGDAVALPTSNATTFSATSPRVAGSIRYNPDNNCLEYLSNTSLVWMSLSGIDTSGFISTGALANYVAKAGDKMEGPLAIHTTGTSNGVVFTGGDGVLTMSSNGAVILPSGNTSERPTPTDGSLRWNTGLEDLEIGSGGVWRPLNETISDAATAVVVSEIAALTIGESKLQDNAVTTPKLIDGAVTDLKLATNAVTTAKLANSAVSSIKIADGAVSNTKMASVPTATIKGRTASGTGAPTDLTIAQVMSMLTLMTGDVGSGGSRGLVPAPAAGDAMKFLRGDATWNNVSLSNLPLIDYDLSGTNGYVKIGVSPNALLVQFGYYGGGSSTPTISFAVPFQEEPRVFLTGRGTGTTRQGAEVPIPHVRAGTVTTTQFAATNIVDQYDQSDAKPYGKFDWFAIGRG